jgi:pimeloyl-ACP methyl ester carboxylesterase
MIRPLIAQLRDATLQNYDCKTDDGIEIGLSRVIRCDEQQDSRKKPAVIVTHGLTTSTDMFVLPETRNFVEVLLDAGYDPWLFDWRGSCRLPYNSRGDSFKLDDVALYDVPKAVSVVKDVIGDKSLFVVAHCVGAMVFAQSMTAGLVNGLTGFISQGVFLTPKMSFRPHMSFSFLSELAAHFIGDSFPVDFRKVGFRSKYFPFFALASIGAKCPDPTCQMLHNSSWCMGASLFEHDHLGKTTHNRLVELLGDVPMGVIPHFRKIILARSLVKWNEGDPRYSVLPSNCLDAADKIDCPILLISGSKNDFWKDSNRLCRDILLDYFPRLNVEYHEIPAYGHLDAFIGRGAALDVFPVITQWIEKIERSEKD